MRLMHRQWGGSARAEEKRVTIDDLAAKMQESRAWIPGKRVRLDFRDRGSILLDGQSERVTREIGPADTVISATWEDWKSLAAGELDPVSAFMSGRLRVEGDLSTAMQLQSALGRAMAEPR